MQGARKVFLAGPRLPEQQDRNVTGLQALRRLDVARRQRIAEIQLIEHAAPGGGYRVVLGRSGPLSAGRLALELRRLRDRKEPPAVARVVDRQGVERFLLAAAHERGQRDVEEAFERRADQLTGALEAELEQGVAVERRDDSGSIQRNDALAPGADQLRAAVEAHHGGVAEAMQEHPVLDHLRRHVHEHQRVLLRAVGLPGGVQHGDQVALVIENRRGAAGEPGVAREEVLVPVDDQRGALEQASAHSVRAAVLFAPHGPEHQSGAKRRIPEAQITVVIEQHAVAIGEDDGVAGPGELVIQVRHLGVGE